MPFFRRRLVRGAVITVSLIVAATMLRLALEWRQALADIDSMIVTPAALDLPAAQSHSGTNPATASEADDPARPGADAPSADGQSSVALSVLEGDTAPALSQETLNILLLGTDARPGDATARTDALVLVRLERETGRVSMLSIPRDLWVDYPIGGEGRINAAYPVGEKRFGPGGGAALAKSTVGALLGVEVDNFVLINFQGFKTLIDQLGGIKVDIPEEIYDPAYPTDDYRTIEVRFSSGVQLLNGERALIYARTRHADNDFGRNQRQQLVLMSIFNRIRERGLLQQLTSLDDYTGALRGYVKTDLSRSRMVELGTFARDISANDVLRYAIDSTAIIDLTDPATFGAEPVALRRLVRQFTGVAAATAGGN